MPCHHFNIQGYIGTATTEGCGCQSHTSKSGPASTNSNAAVQNLSDDAL